MGLPPSAGFIGKFKLLSAAFESGQWWWVVVLSVGGLLAAAYLLRVVALAFHKPSREPAKLPRLMEWTALSLALAAILLGFFATPLLEIFEIGAPLRPPIESEVNP